MKQETKTVTMPLSEFEEMRSRAAQYKVTKDVVMHECRDEICKEMEDLCARILKVTIENNNLKEELKRYKSRKWWQIWKH